MQPSAWRSTRTVEIAAWKTRYQPAARNVWPPLDLADVALLTDAAAERADLRGVLRSLHASGQGSGLAWWTALEQRDSRAPGGEACCLDEPDYGPPSD
jgi:hypothetical protein